MHTGLLALAACGEEGEIALSSETTLLPGTVQTRPRSPPSMGCSTPRAAVLLSLLLQGPISSVARATSTLAELQNQKKGAPAILAGAHYFGGW